MYSKAEISLCHKSPYSQSCGFSISHIWMWELDHKEGWAPNNWCFRSGMLGKTLKSTLNSKDIKPVDLKRKSTLNIHWKDWCWNSTTLATWCEEPTHWKNPWFWERVRAGRRGVTKGEMVEWQRLLNRPEFEQTQGDSEEQGSLVCCSHWDHRESDMT